MENKVTIFPILGFSFTGKGTALKYIKDIFLKSFDNYYIIHASVVAAQALLKKNDFQQDGRDVQRCGWPEKQRR